MNHPRLAIGLFQISLDEEGVAHYSPHTEQRSRVEAELAEYRDFIDRWLDASEIPQPRRLTLEEQQLREILRGLAKGLHRLPRELVEIVIREVPRSLKDRWPTLTMSQIDESAEEVMATLASRPAKSGTSK